MTDKPAVTITIAQTGGKTEEIELEPGESFAETTDGPMFVEVEVHELDIDRIVVDSVSTDEQDDDTGDRVCDEHDYTQCVECGCKYPADFSRCHNCGVPNHDDPQLHDD